MGISYHTGNQGKSYFYCDTCNESQWGGKKEGKKHIESTHGSSSTRTRPSSSHHTHSRSESSEHGSASKRAKTEYTASQILSLTVPNHANPRERQELQHRLNTAQALLEHFDLDEEDVDEGYTAIHSKTPKDSKLTSSLSDSKRTLVIHETFKATKDKLFASDMALKQLAILFGKDSSTIPTKLPREIVHDTVSNDKTISAVRSIASSMKARESFTIKLDFHEPTAKSNQHLHRLLQTPNGKMTTNMIKDFNSLSRTQYYISKAEVDGLTAPEITFSLSSLS